MSRPMVEIVCMDSSSESWEPSNGAISLALSCRWRSRPQHQNRTLAKLLNGSRTHAAAGRRKRMWSRSGSRLGLATNELLHMCCKRLWKPFGDSGDRALAIPKNRQVELHGIIQSNEWARPKPAARRKRTRHDSNTLMGFRQISERVRCCALEYYIRPDTGKPTCCIKCRPCCET